MAKPLHMNVLRWLQETTKFLSVSEMKQTTFAEAELPQ